MLARLVTRTEALYPAPAPASLIMEGEELSSTRKAAMMTRYRPFVALVFIVVVLLACRPASAPGSSPTPAPEERMGYGMQIEPGNDLNRALNLVTAAGFDWIKVQIRWENYESSPGNINWNTIDNVVNAAQARGLKVLFSVVTAPRWARPADTDFSVPGPPANPQDFANFVSD